MSGAIDWPGFFAANDGLTHWGATPDLVARHVAGRPVYLATPYSNRVTDRYGNWSRLDSRVMLHQAALVAALLTAQGVCAISPIVQSAAQCHAVADTMVTLAVPHPHPLDAVAWQRWCWPLLNACAAVVVPDLDGWHDSRGIWAEVCHARRVQMPIFIYATGVPHD